MTSTERKKILIADDEPDVVLYLTTFFSDNGFDTIPAANGRECFDKALTEKPDLITLDITMPEESGVRAFRDLQESQVTKDIPIIIITGISKDFKTFIYGRKVVKPPADFFEKPVDRERLLSRVKEILN